MNMFSTIEIIKGYT